MVFGGGSSRKTRVITSVFRAEILPIFYVTSGVSAKLPSMVIIKFPHVRVIPLILGEEGSKFFPLGPPGHLAGTYYSKD